MQELKRTKKKKAQFQHLDEYIRILKVKRTQYISIYIYIFVIRFETFFS